MSTNTAPFLTPAVSPIPSAPVAETVGIILDPAIMARVNALPSPADRADITAYFVAGDEEAMGFLLDCEGEVRRAAMEAASEAANAAADAANAAADAANAQPLASTLSTPASTPGEADANDALAALNRRIAELESSNATLRAKADGTGRGLSVRVSAKGAASVYGLGRWPVTLYRGQWAKLLEFAPVISTFLVANASKLHEKE